MEIRKSRKMKIAGLGAAALVLSCSAGMGQAPEAVTASSAVALSETKPVEVGNQLCPISGEKVGQMGEIVKKEYNGRVYNFCCAMCLKDFQKDPEKYIKVIEEKGDMAPMNETPAEGQSETGHDGHMHGDH